nr:transcription factor FAMA [Callitriche palustris]
MEKEANFLGNEYYSLEDHNNQEQELFMKPGSSYEENNHQIIDHMTNTNPPPLFSNYCNSSSFDKLSFADVMQFADFGPKLALNDQQYAKNPTDELQTGIDFLKFPVLNDKSIQEDNHNLSLMATQPLGDYNQEKEDGLGASGEGVEARNEENNSSVQLLLIGENADKNPVTEGIKNKRKRPRTIKTSEEVESQRMTHIAVERNRRKQMNEHLRMLRSLMPSSYVQRGDQASIIGGAIEFVRELEQLLQCLESQKRRRLYGDSGPRPVGDSTSKLVGQQQQPPALMFPPESIQNGQVVEYGSGLQEETAEIKSCLADVEVKVLGFDGLIKILSRRRPGQLVKTIAALEDLQLNILHTNITTIEQTVLYSFNVKIGGEARFTAEDIANSVQQIFSFIHANSSTM